MVLGFRLRKLVIYGLYHGRGEFRRTEAVPASYYPGILFEGSIPFAHSLSYSRAHIFIHRLTQTSRLFGPVKNRYGLDRRGNSCNKGLRVERPVKPYLEDAYLLAPGREVIDGLVNGLSARAHYDDYLLGVFSSDVLEKFIRPSGDLGELIHGFLDDAGTRFIVFVGRFAPLKIHVGVLRCTPYHRMFRVHSPPAVGVYELLVYHPGHILKGKLFDLLYFV